MASASTTVKTVKDYNYASYSYQIVNSHKYASEIQHEKEANYAICSENDLWRNYDKVSAKHICTKDITELKEIKICDLEVGVINYNVKIIAKTIVSPRGIMNLTTILQDKYGNICNCAIYNFHQIMQLSIKKLNKILPINTTIIIKEPYIKLFDSHSVAIRIDNPHTNLIIFDDHLQQKQNLDNDAILNKMDIIKLKENGNRYYKQKYFDIAIKFYSIAINKINENENDNKNDDDEKEKKEKENQQDFKVKLLNNRGLCYLQSNKYQQAVNDGLEALKIDNKWIKARYTLCSALYGLKRYKQALETLNQHENKDELQAKLLKKLVKDLKDKILKTSKKFHDFQSKQELVALIGIHDADYISDAIQIAWINEKKGRGVIATRDIKSGTFLLRERHFAFGYPINKWKKYKNANMEVCEEFGDYMVNNELRHCQVYHDISKVNVVTDVMKKIKDCKINRYKFSLLFDGSKRKRNKIIPNMDLFRHNELPKDLKDVPMLSMKNISQICEKNTFSSAHTEECERLMNKYSVNGTVPTSLNIPHGSAIYLVASFFNHADGVQHNCLSDGDHMTKIVFASRDIKKGEELCISYFDTFDDKYPFDYND